MTLLYQGNSHQDADFTIMSVCALVAADYRVAVNRFGRRGYSHIVLESDARSINRYRVKMEALCFRLEEEKQKLLRALQEGQAVLLQKIDHLSSSQGEIERRDK